MRTNWGGQTGEDKAVLPLAAAAPTMWPRQLRWQLLRTNWGGQTGEDKLASTNW